MNWNYSIDTASIAASTALASVDLPAESPQQPALVRHGMKPESQEPFFPYAAYEERMRRWESAATTRLNSAHWSSATGQTINADLAGKLDILRMRSEWEIANNPLVAGMISTYTLTVLGSDGPTLQVISGDEGYKKRREQIWKHWSRNAASNQQLGLIDCMRLWIRSLFASGEFCNQLISMDEEPGPVKMRLLPIHSHRLFTPPEFLGDPAVAMGVRRDLKNRRPTAYYVSQPYIMGAFEVYTGDFLEVPYQDFLHGFLLSEEDQVRGVPWLAPCLDAVAELRDFKVSTLDAARAAADWGVYFYTTSPDIPPVASGNKPMSQTFERRQERNLPPGWQVQQVTPQQPPSNWEMLYKAMAREIGRCVDMPLMMMLLDSSGMNYSSARFDAQMFWRGAGYVQGFLQRVLDRLEHEVAKEAELAYLAGDPDGLPPSSDGPVERRWLWPKAPHVDPQKEAMAERTRLINGDMTYSELCAAHNKNADHIIAQRKSDNAKLKEAGLAPIPGLPDPAAKAATAGGPAASAGQTTPAERPGNQSRAPKNDGQGESGKNVDPGRETQRQDDSTRSDDGITRLANLLAELITLQRGAPAGSEAAHEAAVKAAETRGAAEKKETAGSSVRFEEGGVDEMLKGINGLRADLRGFVSSYSAEEYAKMGGKAFVSDDKQTGFYIKPDGELISVFSNAPRRGDDIMRAAVAAGAKKLDCYEDVRTKHLTALYSRHGFGETQRLDWDDQYAPPGWDYDARNRPPVVFMERKEGHN